VQSVRVNRAFAAGRAHGPAAGLALLDDPTLDVGAYPYADVVRGALLEESGRFREAHACLLAAAQHARNADERAQLQVRIQRVHARIEGGAAHES
jgi:predicted RNA polymerase sigma factor